MECEFVKCYTIIDRFKVKIIKYIEKTDKIRKKI